MYAFVTAMYENMLAYRTYLQGGGEAMFVCRKVGCHRGSECVDTREDGLSKCRNM